eukprot:CAMPEP_0201092792 /NCGR_PEP_ID=MMETSP0812-20130820/1335_1 /ASSEMBLY_ACC=CAM_ASM_000668 /TAXON_ID=98059 /ORGANISM="Dinobryon sp., Strain UTEXLB2267" /LENGTH=306 /DNA_ID=CAMNT_0047344563 /DNA_START=179 /DNA_END=1099 /DNA_ORIENTATION=-
MVSMASKARVRMCETIHMLGLEMSRRHELEQLKIKYFESSKYETNKAGTNGMHIELRNLEEECCGHPIEPLKVSRLRSKISKLEREQDLQKSFLDKMSSFDSLQNQFLNAVLQSDSSLCLTLLQKGVNVNQIVKPGVIPLHNAVLNGSIEVCQTLLEFGGDYSSYLSGTSSLVLAAGRGHRDIIQLLVDFGADVEDKGSGGVPALVMAARKGHVACVEVLLSLGADPNSQDLQENTALHSLAESTASEGDCMLEMLTLLLQAGADPKRTNRLGETPLLAALRLGNLKLAKALNSLQLFDFRTNCLI